MTKYEVLYYDRIRTFPTGGGYYNKAGYWVKNVSREIVGKPKIIGYVEAKSYYEGMFRAVKLATSQGLKMSHVRIKNTGEVKVKGHWTTRHGERVKVEDR